MAGSFSTHPPLPFFLFGAGDGWIDGGVSGMQALTSANGAWRGGVYLADARQSQPLFSRKELPTA